MRTISITIVLLWCAAIAIAQSPTERAQSRRQNQLGWEYMRGEKFEEAAKAFQNAIDLDPNYAFAHYGLGRADMALKRFVAAVIVLSKCRDLYGAEAGRQFSSTQELQQRRRDRLTELDEMTRQLSASPQNQQTAQQNRQIDMARRTLQDALARGNDVTIAESSVPAWVSLSLGSAFFRTGNLLEAEKAYKATIEADPRSGEAFQNLAVVYMETDRISDAEAALNEAKKTGFKVNAQLEQDIQDRKRRKP